MKRIAMNLASGLTFALIFTRIRKMTDPLISLQHFANKHEKSKQH